MSQLSELKQDLFFAEIPQLPQGRYVHFVMVRETESFPVFQTEIGILNTIRVQAGLKPEHADSVSRLVMFKRKQSSPERLTGRELLRWASIISGEKDHPLYCEYNSDQFCKQCPDCIHYGYAIGNAGAEKSKVLSDSAFSLTPYDFSHKGFTMNGLNENGTMWDPGASKPRPSLQMGVDHIVPQVFFPTIETLRDPTYEGFLYVLGNLLRTDRYGAQETRTGKVHNHLVAICFANGEIFSNLKFAQAMYDIVADEELEPLKRDVVLNAAVSAYQTLMADEPVSVLEEILDTQLQTLLKDVNDLYQDETKTKEFLKALDEKSRAYAKKFGSAKTKSKGKKKAAAEEEEES